MPNKFYVPTPIFNTLEEVMNQYKIIYANENPHLIIERWLNHCFLYKKIIAPPFAIPDYKMALNFLYSYRGSADTFSAYRREVERFLQWSWFVQKKSILGHKREDIESFIEFCLKPPKSWIGLKKATRFKVLDGVPYPNPEWRPFEAHLSKKDHKDGLELNKATYQFSQPALKVMFGILSSFYNFLLQEGIVQANPIVLIRQKSKFIRKQTKTQIVRRLSNQQWETVIHLAKEQAQRDRSHERTVFILSCLYGMYLRISELVENPRWMPTMGDFFKDSENNWWFKTVGKGNKERQIAVSDAMLEALKHYRETYLKLPPTPMPNEQTPLVAHLKNPNKPITSVRPIRGLVQDCFDVAASYIERQGNQEEALALRVATVHWLRHTGISEDVKHRPREHVRDDAGHSSSAITDRYIDIELRERAKSAKKKVII
jgi:site-specific recombinase XerD